MKPSDVELPLGMNITNCNDYLLLRIAETVVLSLGKKAPHATLSICMSHQRPRIFATDSLAFKEAVRTGRLVGVYAKDATSHQILEDLQVVREEVRKQRAAARIVFL